MSRAEERALHFIHPGSIDRTTGGTIYDRRVIDALRREGWRIDLHELQGHFPVADAATMRAAAALLIAIPDGSRVAIDGLALPAFADSLPRHAGRFPLAGLVHHPNADETGLAAAARAQLFATERTLFALLRRVIVPSPAMVRRLADFAVPAARIRVVPPGVEPAERARGSGGGLPRLLCVASLTPRKGHVALLEALSDCADLDWTLTCAGPIDLDAETARRVTDAVDRLGLADRVRLTGPQYGVALDALYAGSDLFVLASRYEGYGMVFAEAMARGLPIVASGEGAVADTVPDAAGIVVPVDDRAALAAALRRMIGDHAFRRRTADGAWRAGQSLPRWSDAARAFAQALPE